MKTNFLISLLNTKCPKSVNSSDFLKPQRKKIVSRIRFWIKNAVLDTSRFYRDTRTDTFFPKRTLSFLSVLALTLLVTTGCKNQQKEQPKDKTTQATEAIQQNTNAKFGKEIAGVFVHPISHASMVLEWGDEIIYNDPVGDQSQYKECDAPDLILVSDTHGDHLSVETIKALVTANTQIIAPKAVVEKLPAALLPQTKLLSNDETIEVNGIEITAVPMYNLREEAKDFHIRGRGNGYLLEKDETRIYISGDTEDIPEMRNLQDIDLAFVCMNLPYTMPVDAAASAVIDFQPATVVPYHFRGKDGMSDVEAFQNEVNAKAPQVNVVMLDWYPSANE